MTSSYYWGGSSRKVHWTENMDHGNFQFRPRFHPFDHRDVYDEPSGVLSLDRLNLGSQKGHSQKCSIYFIQIRNKSWVTLAGKLQIYLVRVSIVGHRAGGSRESRYIYAYSLFERPTYASPVVRYDRYGARWRKFDLHIYFLFKCNLHKSATVGVLYLNGNNK